MPNKKVFTDEQKRIILDDIYYKMSEGNSLLSILTESKVISRQAFYDWLKEFGQKELDNYNNARELMFDAMLENCLEIADNKEGDVAIGYTKNNEAFIKPNYEHINRSRLRCDVRLKIVEMTLAQKRFKKQETKEQDVIEIVTSSIENNEEDNI